MTIVFLLDSSISAANWPLFRWELLLTKLRIYPSNLRTAVFRSGYEETAAVGNVLGILVGTLCAILLAGRASASEPLTQEFHQTYTLNADGRVSLENINGAVTITGWESQ